MRNTHTHTHTTECISESVEERDCVCVTDGFRPLCASMPVESSIIMRQ